MKEILKNKNYIFTVSAAALFYTAVFMLNSVCGKYTLEIGGSKTTAGIVTCAFTLASFFTRPVWGWLSDAKSRKKTFMAGAVLCFISTVTLIITRTVWLLITTRVVFGIGYSALTTAGGTIICDIVSDENLPAAISFYGVTNVLSQAAAPALALWLYSKNFIILSTVVSFVIASVILGGFFIKYNEKQYLNPNKIFEIYEKTALPAAAVILFFAASTASVYSFVPLMARERKLGGTGIFFAVSAAGLLVSRLFNTAFCRRAGVNRVFYTGAVMFSAGFALLAFASNALLFLAAGTIYGLGAGFIHPVVNTAAVADCSSEKRGLATGTFMMSQDLGMTAGALVWGYVSEKLGFDAVYSAVAVLGVAMLFTFSKLIAGRKYN